MDPERPFIRKDYLKAFRSHFDAGTCNTLKPPKPYCVDIHCHSTLLGFNRNGRYDGEEFTADRDAFWPNPDPPKEVKIESSQSVPKTYQASFTVLAKSDVRVAFAALYALEQGFLWRHMQWLGRLGTEDTLKITDERARKVQDDKHDYFQELQSEFCLLSNEDFWTCPESPTNADANAPPNPNWPACAEVKVVGNYGELSTVVGKEEDEKTATAVIVTVEGGHCLGGGSALWLKKVKGSGNLLQGLVDDAGNLTAAEIGALLNAQADFCDKLRRAVGNRDAGEASALLHGLADNCKKLRNILGDQDTKGADKRLVAVAGYCTKLLHAVGVRDNAQTDTLLDVLTDACLRLRHGIQKTAEEADERLDALAPGYKEMDELRLVDPGFVNPTSDCEIVKRFLWPEVQEFVLKLLRNIQTMKAWGDGGKFAPFFITFSHHFWNQLCGHNVSLPFLKSVLPILNQNRGVEWHMTEVGKVVVGALLATSNGRRVLIDTKHMSMPGKDWYFGCVEKFNSRKSDAEKIPIISSHSAFKGKVPMPREPVTKDAVTADLNYLKSTRFNPWDMNLSATEIQRIHKSNGLVGLNFDERVTIGNLRRFRLKNCGQAEWTNPIADHIYHFAKAIADGRKLSWEDQQREKVWGRLAIGSDFDGVINPLDGYSSARELGDLAVQLTKRFKEMSTHGAHPLLHVPQDVRDEQIGQIVRMFLYQNAMNFLETYFTDAYRLAK